jgi:hypothetical protein
MNTNKPPRITFSLVLYLLPFFALSQSPLHTVYLCKPLTNHTVTTVITTISGAIPGSEGKNTANSQSTMSAPKKNDKMTWQTTFEDKNTGQITVTKKLKHIVFTINIMALSLKYDSGDPSQTGFGLSMATHYDPFFDDPRIQTITNNAVTKPAAPNNIDSLWNRDLPKYDSTLYWNGLLFTPPIPQKLNKDVNWQSELNLKDKIIKNDYTIQSVSVDSITVKLKSHEFFKDTSHTVIETQPPMGESFGSKLKEKEFNGTLVIDPKVMLIEHAEFQIEYVTISSLKGIVSEKRGHSTTTVTNTVK